MLKEKTSLWSKSLVKDLIQTDEQNHRDNASEDRRCSLNFFKVKLDAT